MKYSEVPEGAIFYIEGCYSYPKRKVGLGHVDIRDGCANSHGSPDWEVELAESLPNKACTRLETGAANADSESNPAVSSG
jgi:hypothetical protein